MAYHTQMQNYPIFIDLKGQQVLVVGGGEIAARKIRLMSLAGAEITIIAPELGQTILSEMSRNITHIARQFRESDIGDYRLITAATDDLEINRRVSELAQQRNIPVNVVDQPDLCSFITPSIIDRSPVLIAVSTGGGAPVLARILRSKLEAFIPASYGQLANSMRQLRDKVKDRFSEESERRHFWEKVVQGPIAEMFFSGREEQGKIALEAAIEKDIEVEKGEVWLIGAGPGDPDLLTFRALRLMQQCDVVLYDRLVSDEILSLCRRDADRIYVGKKRSNHAVPQQGINQLLVDLASEGKRVVRLKGGDPFIFGRGGEEIEQLVEQGIPFQVVPGITAASGCATYAGIPLTHRDHAQSVMFVTGHLKDDSVDLNWPLLATPNQTVVIYMGLVGLPTICQQLVSHGVSPDMPIAVIQQGTTPGQKVLSGTLETMPDMIEQHEIKPPTLIIVGQVVRLQKTLNWFQPTKKH
ncbi:MAG: siroheme synthase CysG [Arenicella sp.]